MRVQLDLAKTPFSLDHTLSCGQTFKWEEQGDWWIGVVSETALRIRQKDGALEFEASSKDVDSGFLWRYFRLDDDLPMIYSKIMKDKHVKAAVNQFRGLRLIKQEPWECLISYICATNKNIPAIKQMIHNICKRFGRTINFEGKRFFTFPKPEALAKATLSELRLCKLGYRAEFVLETARIMNKGDFNLEALRTVPYERAKKELMPFPGVGSKVADCVLLFSLDKLEAFPIDVWMKRVILEYYPQYFKPEFITRMSTKKGLSTGEYKTIYDFGKKYFGDYLGYAQEYLYHHKRCQIAGIEIDKF